MTPDSEKQPLQPAPELSPAASRSYHGLLLRLVCAYLLVRLVLSPTVHEHVAHRIGHHRASKPTHGCVQYPALVPPADERLDGNRDLIFGPVYTNKSISLLSGLVQVHRESFDDNGEVSGPNADPRWDVFYNVSSFLATKFPLLHESMKLDKVNTHGLVYTWEGSDTTLKPLLLMAHQDTVPVNPATIDSWTHPPWSGHYDGKFLWGRGASDDTNMLLAELEAATLLLEGGFVPRRTVLFAFGFDEESKGLEGAGHIAPYLESIYGKDGIALIVDEGGLGLGEMFGAGFASPSTGEKGYLDVRFTLDTPGGHSSVPPAHTGIGMLSALVTVLEAHPYAPSISTSSPIFSLLQCAATHGDLPRSLKDSLKSGAKGGKKGEKAREAVSKTFAKMGDKERYLVSTSQAVDIFHAGVKVNALPETTVLTVNYRISVDSEPNVVKDKIVRLVAEWAKKFDLSVTAFGEKLDQFDGTRGHLTILGINELNPAPISPISTPEWALLSGTIQSVFAPYFPDGLTVAPSIMTGNTDTRFMWNLSKNIYRFTPASRSGDLGIHTVNERLEFLEHLKGVFFFHELIRSVQTDF